MTLVSGGNDFEQREKPHGGCVAQLGGNFGFHSLDNFHGAIIAVLQKMINAVSFFEISLTFARDPPIIDCEFRNTGFHLSRIVNAPYLT
jgi:hypothetical protein